MFDHERPEGNFDSIVVVVDSFNDAYGVFADANDDVSRKADIGTMLDHTLSRKRSSAIRNTRSMVGFEVVQNVDDDERGR